MTLRKFISLLLAALMVMALSACGGPAPEPATAAATETVTPAAPETKAPETQAPTTASNETKPLATVAPETKAPETEAPTTKAVKTVTDFWKEYEGMIFGFTSGAGAWETFIMINGDGSFDGEFYDANMGETGEGYDDGTVYECFFTGKFAAPEVVDELTLISKVEKLDYEIKEEYISDNTKYIPTWPYGISEGDDVTIYLPGSKVEDFSEEFMSWAWLALPSEATETVEILLKVGYDDFCFFPDHYAMGDSDEFYSGEVWESERAKAMRRAYENQEMPNEEMIPYVYGETAPASPYESVTLANLQGSWVNTYSENGSSYTEILTVNGEYGKMETYRDGVKAGVWNGTGTCSIEDRSADGKCPAFRITDESGQNLCTIYIRWVKGGEFYDGGFLNSWYYVNEDEPDDWLYDTVTIGNLQGVWYSEMEDGSKRVQTVLVMKDDQATLFETVDGEPATYWNGKGTARIDADHGDPYNHVPELIIDFTEGVSKGGSAGIYISEVDDMCFYDAAMRRYFVKMF
ncbi:MAG: hypothetical protein MJ059_06695 [Lachnospiraceae bacterium]|nr:hypothetical protein [Lachnospiraceae bacterium]